MSRPGSSLGLNSSSNFSTMNSNRDVQYYTSPNSSTKIVRERSVSPTSGRRTFKTSKYEYSNSSSSANGGINHILPSSGLDSGYNTSSKVNVETSINQLDSLLDELKVERDLANEPSTFVFVRHLFPPPHHLISLHPITSRRHQRHRQAGGQSVSQSVSEKGKNKCGDSLDIFSSHPPNPNPRLSPTHMTHAYTVLLFIISSVVLHINECFYCFSRPFANCKLWHRFGVIVSDDRIVQVNSFQLTFLLLLFSPPQRSSWPQLKDRAHDVLHQVVHEQSAPRAAGTQVRLADAQ